jgi:hypothetical protein
VESVLPSKRPFRASRGLTYLGGFFGYGLAISALYATTGIGLPCPFRALTGWQCPLCGGTRLGRALLDGDVAAAFAYNPLVLVGLAVLTVLGALWTVEVLGGPAVRPPRAWAARAQAVHPTHWLVLGLAVAAAFVLLRNLL